MHYFTASLAESTVVLNNSKIHNSFKGVKKIAVFAGTTEGRLLVQKMQSLDFELSVFVATEYGASMLEAFEDLNLYVGRKDKAEIAHIIESNDLIVDATHPFATEVSETLRNLSSLKEKNYLRIAREDTNTTFYENQIRVNSFEEAAEFLRASEGTILLATGSKNLETFTSISGFRDRLYVRVLPDPASILRCHELGVKASHVMALQGPFSVELNEALLKQCNAKFFVTKDSGSNSGFIEKLTAAKNLGITLVSVNRPQELTETITVDEILAFLESRNSLTNKLSETSTCPSSSPAKKSNSPRGRDTFFPLFLNLKGKECLVIGAGKVGLRRASVLADFGAKVTLIDPIINQSNRTSLVEGCCGKADTEMSLIGRKFKHSDVRNKFLVVAATNSRIINDEIYRYSKAEGCHVNIADKPDDCDFYFPALVKGTSLLAGVISLKMNHSFLRESAVQLRTCIRSLEENDTDE